MPAFSGQGETPYRRYAALALRARERLPGGRVSRSGAKPEPTVIVRMKENARADPLKKRSGAHVIALGDVSLTERRSP